MVWRIQEQLGAQHVCMQHQCHKPVNERVLSEKGWMVLETFWSFLGLRWPKKTDLIYGETTRQGRKARNAHRMTRILNTKLHAITKIDKKRMRFASHQILKDHFWVIFLWTKCSSKQVCNYRTKIAVNDIRCSIEHYSPRSEGRKFLSNRAEVVIIHLVSPLCHPTNPPTWNLHFPPRPIISHAYRPINYLNDSISGKGGHCFGISSRAPSNPLACVTRQANIRLHTYW